MRTMVVLLLPSLVLSCSVEVRAYRYVRGGEMQLEFGILEACMQQGELLSSIWDTLLYNWSACQWVRSPFLGPEWSNAYRCHPPQSVTPRATSKHDWWETQNAMWHCKDEQYCHIAASLHCCAMAVSDTSAHFRQRWKALDKSQVLSGPPDPLPQPSTHLKHLKTADPLQWISSSLPETTKTTICCDTPDISALFGVLLTPWWWMCTFVYLTPNKYIHMWIAFNRSLPCSCFSVHWFHGFMSMSHNEILKTVLTVCFSLNLG